MNFEEIISRKKLSRPNMFVSLFLIFKVSIPHSQDTIGQFYNSDFSLSGRVFILEWIRSDGIIARLA